MQDAFCPIPSLISYAGVIERWGLLSHAQNGVRWLALTKMHTHTYTHTHPWTDVQTHTHAHMDKQTNLLLWSRQSLASFITTSWAACSCPNWTCSTAYTGDRKNTPLNFWHSHNSTCMGPGIATYCNELQTTVLVNSDYISPVGSWNGGYLLQCILTYLNPFVQMGIWTTEMFR